MSSSRTTLRIQSLSLKLPVLKRQITPRTPALIPCGQSMEDAAENRLVIESYPFLPVEPSPSSYFLGYPVCTSNHRTAKATFDLPARTRLRQPIGQHTIACSVD